MKKLLETGQKAPDFSLKNQNGEERTLQDYLGKKLIIFFYPKDLTPTCTTEACNLRDNYKALQDAGYQVVGVSPDDEKSHGKFIEKKSLPFELLADTEKKMLEDYGVWGEKKMYGKTYMGVHRTTYVLDEESNITQVIAKVKSKEHAAQILEEEA